MNVRVEKILFLVPRILSVLFAIFLGVFALDVFGEGRGLAGTAVALFMHLVPSFIILAVLAVSWRREWVGAIGFPTLAMIYLAVSWGRFHRSAPLFISGPLFLIGALFGLEWVLKNNMRAGS